VHLRLSLLRTGSEGQSQSPLASALQPARAWELVWLAVAPELVWLAVAPEPSGREQVASAQVARPEAFEKQILLTVGPDSF